MNIRKIKYLKKGERLLVLRDDWKKKLKTSRELYYMFRELKAAILDYTDEKDLIPSKQSQYKVQRESNNLGNYDYYLVKG